MTDTPAEQHQQPNLQVGTGWYLRITGNQTDIEDALQLNLGDMRLVEYEPTIWGVTGKWQFDDGSSNPDELVRTQGTEVIERINGVCSLMRQSFQNIAPSNVVQITASGQKNAFVVSSTPLIATVRFPTGRIGLKGNPNGPAPKSIGDTAFEVSRDNERLHYVLTEFSKRPRTFGSLYPVWEVLMTTEGYDSWPIAPLEKRFRRTANSIERHDPFKFRNPKNPLPIAEAEAAIRSSIKAWIRSMKP